MMFETLVEPPYQTHLRDLDDIQNFYISIAKSEDTIHNSLVLSQLKLEQDEKAISLPTAV